MPCSRSTTRHKIPSLTLQLCSVKETMEFKNWQKPENNFLNKPGKHSITELYPAPVTNPKEKDEGPSVFGSGDWHQGSTPNLCLNGDTWLSTLHITEMPPVQGGVLDSSGLACGTKLSPRQMLAILSPTVTEALCDRGHTQITDYSANLNAAAFSTYNLLSTWHQHRCKHRNPIYYCL